jgi:hypothetical protein
MFRTFPSIRISWRDVWPGAVLAGVGWELLKWLFVVYSNRFANWQAVYGPVAGVIGLLTWLYMSFTVILFGSEFAAALGRARAIQALDQGDERQVPALADDQEPSQPVPVLSEERQGRGGSLVSGTAAGVLGLVAAVVVGVGVLVGGVRRLGRVPGQSDHSEMR